MSATPSASPAQQLAAQIDELQRRVNGLQASVLFADVKDELENLDSQAAQWPVRLKSVRAGGYVFGRDLESLVTSLSAQWPSLKAAAQRQITEQGPALASALRTVEAQMTGLNAKRNAVAAGQTAAAQLDRSIDALEARAAAARDAIRGGYDTFKAGAGDLQQRLDRVQGMLEWLGEAKFTLLATEGLYAAVEAKWDRDGKDDPKGRLYLTDQRILFEQKEEVATKKLLFITTEKEKVQQLLLEVPLAWVDDARGSKKGLLGHEDHLDLALASDAPVRGAHFHLNGQDSSLWQQLITRAKSRDLDHERAVPVDQAVVTKAASAPTRCSNCGASFTKPVLRGQSEIACEFCGSVTRF